MSTNPALRSTETETRRFTSADRIPAFDGLRGVAVLAVLLYHLSDYCPVDSRLSEQCRFFLRGGWCGVDLFFVLSGFLITSVLMDTRSAANYFRAFYARRILRIFPVYYATLILVLLASQVLPPLSAVLPPLHDRFFYFVFLSNWWGLLRGVWQTNVIGHFWSLAVEEQFYFVWPFLIWRLSARDVKWVTICGIALAPVVRVALYAKWGPVRDIVENPFCRMDALLMGALLALLIQDSPTRWLVSLQWASALTGVAIFAGSFSEVFILKVAHSTLFIGSGLALVFGGLVSAVFESRGKETPLQKAICLRPIILCGKYSYGMYVYHVPLLWLVVHSLNGSKPVSTLPGFVLLSALVILLTFAVAKVSFDYFEIRFLRLKPRFAAR